MAHHRHDDETSDYEVPNDRRGVPSSIVALALLFLLLFAIVIVGGGWFLFSARRTAVEAEMVARERAELARFEAEKAQQDAIMAHARAAGVMKPAPTSPDDDVQKEFKALEGTWKAVAMEAGGKQLPKDGLPDFTFIVAAAGKSTAKTPQREDQTTIDVDPKKTPKTIDNLHGSGPHKGKKQFGIYKLEGDTWTVCMSLAGAAEGDRPKDFTTKDSTNVVFVFERVKRDKK